MSPTPPGPKPPGRLPRTRETQLGRQCGPQGSKKGQWRARPGQAPPRKVAEPRDRCSPEGSSPHDRRARSLWWPQGKLVGKACSAHQRPRVHHGGSNSNRTRPTRDGSGDSTSGPRLGLGFGGRGGGGVNDGGPDTEEMLTRFVSNSNLCLAALNLGFPTCKMGVVPGPMP